MRSSLYLCLATAALLGLTQKGRAQAEIKHPDGELPKKLFTYPKSTRPRVVWLAYAGFNPHVLPDVKSKTIEPKKPIKFLQSFFVADVRNEQDFHLVVGSEDGEKVSEYIGWVPGRYLVRTPSADIDPDTGIMRKALVVNTRDSLGDDLKAVMIRHAPLSSAPGQDEPQRLYTTMFVYGEADNFVLVGDASSFNSRRDEDAAKVVLGWLPKNRIAIWNTREALEWNHETSLEPKDRPHHVVDAPRPTGPPRRTVIGRIFKSLDLAKQGLKDPATEGIFEEEMTDSEPLGYRISPRLDPDAPRFPVLRRVEGARNPRAGDLFEVGGIGGLCDAKGKLLLSDQDVKKLQDILDSIRSQVTQTDILFVIDDTESMTRWFKVVADTVRKITATTRDRKLKVRVAVSFYNDETKESLEKKRPPVSAAPLRDVNESGEQIAREVEKHEYCLGGDPPEMVFRGIVEAYDAAKFRAQSRKLLIVIGDSGDISASASRMKADPEYAKKYNVKAIVDRLVPDNLDREAPVEFYAVRVGTSVAEEDYKSQMKEIVKQYSDRLLEQKKKQFGEKFDEKTFRAPAVYFDPEENRGSTIADTLEGQYQRLVKEVLQREEDIVRMKKGQWVNTKLTPEMERQINRELEKRGLKVTLEDLRRSGGVQLFETGCVWEKSLDRIPQVRRRVFLNDAELKELIDLLGALDTRTGSDISLPELLAGIIERQANTGDRTDPDRLKKLSLKDLLKQMTGLSFRNSLMGKKYEELKAGRGDIQDSEYFALLHCRDLLRDVYEGKSQDYSMVERVRAKQKIIEFVRKGMPRDEPRGFYLGKDKATRWYYLDYEKEWP